MAVACSYINDNGVLKDVQFGIVFYNQIRSIRLVLIGLWAG